MTSLLFSSRETKVQPNNCAVKVVHTILYMYNEKVIDHSFLVVNPFFLVNVLGRASELTNGLDDNVNQLYYRIRNHAHHSRKPTIIYSYNAIWKFLVWNNYSFFFIPHLSISKRPFTPWSTVTRHTIHARDCTIKSINITGISMTCLKILSVVTQIEFVLFLTID